MRDRVSGRKRKVKAFDHAKNAFAPLDRGELIGSRPHPDCDPIFGVVDSLHGKRLAKTSLLETFAQVNGESLLGAAPSPPKPLVKLAILGTVTEKQRLGLDRPGQLDPGIPADLEGNSRTTRRRSRIYAYESGISPAPFQNPKAGLRKSLAQWILCQARAPASSFEVEGGTG